jgi:type I restriction enzyme, S subunit
VELKEGYQQTEVGVIPEDWEATRVGGLASPIRNAIVGGPFGSDLVSLDYVDDGVPVIRGQNMSSQWVTGKFVFVSSAKANSLDANLARPGDIIFTQRGTLGQVSVIPEKPYERYLVSQSQMKLTVNRTVTDALFVYYVFTSGEMQERIRTGTIQTGVPHINLGILRDIPVQLPPLREQRAIAETLSDVDALLAKQDQLIAKKRDIKQGAMQKLLTGQQRLPGFSGKWEVKKLGEILSVRHGRGQHGIAVDNGRYPILGTGGEMGRTNHFLYDKPSVLIGRKGTIDNPLY